MKLSPPITAQEEIKRGDTSITSWVFERMLARIQCGEWPVGGVIPSERALQEELGVSRIALRESISRLRALGLLNVAHGKRTTVSKMDSSIVGRLFPLMLSLEGQQTFQDILQVRLPLEMESVALASQRRSAAHMGILDELIADMQAAVIGSPERWAQLDIAFHIQIANASGNKLFAPLLEVLSGFVTRVMETVFSEAPDRPAIANNGHRLIAAAMREQDSARARKAMEEHLLFAADFAAEVLFRSPLRPFTNSSGEEGACCSASGGPTP